MEQTQESPTETQQPQELESPTEEEQQLWWSKIEPLLSTFRTACQAYLILGTDIAIEEIMVRFYGRSSDTCKMPNKPIKQGYKIFALADDGYVWHFQLSSRCFSIAELEKVDERAKKLWSMWCGNRCALRELTMSGSFYSQKLIDT